MEFKLGELFCGPGGLGLGALRADVKKSDETYSIEHAWATDFDKDSCESYRRNICPENPESVICADVRKLDIKKLPDIDALTFGFPCNDFSIVGEQKGINGSYGPLYSYGVKALKYFQPDWFLAENVGGLKSANNGTAFRIILSELQEAGYELTVHLYHFEKYKVPQTRRRIFIIGIRRNLGLDFKVPVIPGAEIITCREAVENPPIPKNAPNNEYTQQSPQVIERLKYIKPGENAFNADLPSHLVLNIKGAKISQIYKRLDPDRPAYTITGSGGGGTHVYHWKENRALTNRERARLQTFPDDFIFSGSKESVRKQIGMAVPPAAAQIVYEAVLKTFAGIEYPSRKPNLNVYLLADSRKSEQPDLFQELRK